VKLYGKKMMALVLTFAMVMSVCNFTAFAAEDFDIKHTMEYTGRSSLDEVNLLYLVEEELSDYYEENIVIDWFRIETTDAELDYGYFDRDDYCIDLSITSGASDQLEKDGYLYEEVIYYSAEDTDQYEYEGKIEITISIYNNDLEYEMAGATELELGKELAGDLYNLMTEDLDYVEFDLDRYNDCGDLYVYDAYDEEWVDFDATEKYYYLPDSRYDYDLEDLIFEHDGTEGEYVIYYTAYGMLNEKIEGTITIYCDSALFLEATITSEETYTFDSEAFQEAVEDWNSAYTLVYIDNVKLGDSKDGVLYYDYDEDSKRNVEISSKEEYYVESTSYDLIDYITFVPVTDLEDTVIVHFDAYVEKGRSDDIIPGVLKIDVEKAADITIKADIDEEVEIDYSLFQDYLEEDLDSYKYDVSHVTISGAPRSKDAGYLVVDEEKLDTRSDKTFYMDAGKNEYSLKDLYYQAGGKKGTYSATFTVYYYKDNARNPSASSEGTIDFIVGSGSSSTPTDIDSISNKTPMMASEVMNFSDVATLSAFKGLGNNDNVYVTFNSLPVGGKLVYNWGTPSQEDVNVYTAYYIGYNYMNKQLGNITFVPSYSSVKTPKTITFGVTGYNQKDKPTYGLVNITVNYAARSTKFSDVTTATYADSVDFLANEGITTGMSATTFGPNTNVTRAQFVTFLYRAAGEPSVAGLTNKFKDVSPTVHKSYYNAILWAVQNNITTGTSATAFSPDANVTHEQLITFLYRYDVKYLGHPDTGSSYINLVGWSSMADSYYASTPAKWAANKGILTDSTTYPTTAGTRATVALWLHRMLTL